MSDEQHVDRVNAAFCRWALSIAAVVYLLAGGLG